MDMKSLRQGSKPEYFRLRNTYTGPPIGYGAKVVKHHSPDGAASFSIHGNPIAPRPAFFMKCHDADCVKCGREPVSSASASEGSTPKCAAKAVDEKEDKDSVAA
ncbi:hypothetical protein PRZ48_001780 [Zasmidium cellare]|uniref:Uncharacterized protein n=1 Tax=Zasmidium cellare TaxID=395010 RepID=A0ABR0F4M6_ZASCE|nr:hypothetical protein PRZ48_001780 [Zasmidium cellare]